MSVVGSGHITNSYVAEGYAAGVPAYSTEFLLEVSDSLVLTDDLQGFEIGKSFNEQLSLTELFSKLSNYYRTLTEDLSLTEYFTKIPARIFSNLLGLAESVVKGTPKSVEDNLVLDDDLDKSVQFSRSLSDDLNVTDLLHKLPVRIFTEFLSLVDSIVNAAVRAFNDGLSLSELFRTNVSFLEVDDSFSLSDTLTKIRTYVSSLIDSLNLVDTIKNFVRKTFNETILFIEKVLKYKNGIPLVWEFLVNKVGTWTKKTNVVEDEDWTSKGNITEDDDWTSKENITEDDDWTNRANIAEDSDWIKKDNVT